MPDGLTRDEAISGPHPMLLTTDAVGGVWRYSLDLAAGLHPRPLLAVLGPPPSATQRAEADALGLRLIETGLPLDWTAETPAELQAVAAQLRRLAARKAVASVHLHAPALVGPEPWPVPVVAVAHSCVATWWAAVRGGDLPPDFAWRTAAAHAGLHAADAVIAPTHAHAAATSRAYGNLPITVVHNGIAAFWPPSTDGRRVILTAGRLWDEGKNAAALDRVAPALDAPIRAAGPVTGPNGARIDLPNLHLLGTLDPRAMRRAYAEATVFASLAHYEPFGLSVLEAAQAGLRLVLSDIPSFRELWDGVARFVAPGADPAPALRGALADHGDGGAAARAGRYTMRAMIDGTRAVHRRVAVRV